MTARPPESPIDVSSSSPTPTRPPISLPRRSSSRLRELHEPIGPAMSNARQQQPSDGNEADEIQLPARRRDPYVLMPTHGPRHGLALPTAPTHAVAGPSRGAQVIDLTEDDDDDIEITGEAAPVRPADDGARFIGRPAAHEPRRVIRAQRPDFRYIPRPREEAAPYDVNAWRDLNELNQAVEYHGRAARALILDQDQGRDLTQLVHAAEYQGRAVRARQDAEQQRQRMEDVQARQNALAHMRERRARIEQYRINNDLPPPPPADAPPAAPRERIGLGGAVLRRGGQQINYGAALPARRQVPYHDPAEYEQRLNERMARVDRAREAQYAGHHGEIAGIMQNLRQDDPDRQRMEAVLHRLRPAGQLLADLGLNHLGIPQHRLEEPSVIIARQAPPVPLDLPEGYTSNFDLNDTIEIDQPKHMKRFMACTRCGDPLYLNDGQKSTEDRVWGLRCGHLLDQRCLHEISSPQEEKDRMNITRPPPAGLDVLGEEGKRPGKKTKYSRKAKKTVNEPVEYEWKCPVKACGWAHVSVLKEAEWKQDDEEGAVQLYV